MNKDGEYIAIGLKNGEIIIIKASKDFTQFIKCDSKRQRESVITDIK